MKKDEEGREGEEEAIVPSIPREEEIITNLMFNFYLLAISLAKTPPLLLLPLLHPWRNRGGKFPTSNFREHACSFLPSLAHLLTERRNVEKYKRGGKIGGITSRYARRKPQSKECENICITSSDDRLFCFAQHLFEFTTRYVYPFPAAYPRFYPPPRSNL